VSAGAGDIPVGPSEHRKEMSAEPARLEKLSHAEAVLRFMVPLLGCEHCFLGRIGSGLCARRAAAIITREKPPS